jgi:hypothetical protein
MIPSINYSHFVDLLSKRESEINRTEHAHNINSVCTDNIDQNTLNQDNVIDDSGGQS